MSSRKLPTMSITQETGYRLVNSRFPPVSLFDDVADQDEFDLLYELQSLTNPRVQTELGQLNLVPREEIPFGIAGCTYATAPFTHVNPEGSRFSDGQFGVLYMGDTLDTAITEVAYHQSSYWRRVTGLSYDRLVFRGLTCRFGPVEVVDATALPPGDAIYDPCDYSASRSFGKALKKEKASGLRYRSVRLPGAICWGLFSPRSVKRITQAAHYEFIWDGQAISSIGRVINYNLRG
ncbi:RES family NAD+ phosphorylase [Hydrocarboniclastica marina]|nr:RES family NAD+ phosphorylase [Hydrocarboniclastica marina]